MITFFFIAFLCHFDYVAAGTFLGFLIYKLKFSYKSIGSRLNRIYRVHSVKLVFFCIAWSRPMSVFIDVIGAQNGLVFYRVSNTITQQKEILAK